MSRIFQTLRRGWICGIKFFLQKKKKETVSSSLSHFKKGSMKRWLRGRDLQRLSTLSMRTLKSFFPSSNPETDFWLKLWKMKQSWVWKECLKACIVTFQERLSCSSQCLLFSLLWFFFFLWLFYFLVKNSETVKWWKKGTTLNFYERSK